MAYGEDRLWIGTVLQGDSALRVINPESGRVEDEFTPPVRLCRGVGYWDESIWFLGVDSLYQLTSEGRVVGRTNPAYDDMIGIAFAENGYWTVALFEIGSYLVHIPFQGGARDSFRITVQNPGDIAWDGEYIWLTDPAEGFIHQLDVAQRREVNIFPTPAAVPTAIAWGDGGVYLIDSGDGAEDDILYHIDPAGEAGPRLLPAARVFDFGFTDIGDRVEYNFALYNIGSVALSVDDVHLTQGNNGFTLGQIADVIVIEPGRFALVPIYFEAMGYGWHEDELSISSNDPLEGEMLISLRGFGLFNHRSLAIFPDTIDFGVVRADPRRDGSRAIPLYLVNQGRDRLRVDNMFNNIEEIFSFTPPEYPAFIDAAETLSVDIWFTPHRGILYIDTLAVFSNHPGAPAVDVYLFGAGNDSVYAGGEVLWQLRLGNEGIATGAIAEHSDINDDGIREVVAVMPDGTVICVNGFASGDADVRWVQAFHDEAFRPTGVLPVGSAAGGRDLNGDGWGDVVLGSGTGDRAVYGLDGISGRLLWRWDAERDGADGGIVRLDADFDFNADGAADPVVLTGAGDGATSMIVQIDGATGMPAWIRNISASRLLEPLGDLDLDGITDFIAHQDNGSLTVVSGASGALMQRFQVGEFFSLSGIQDIDGDGLPDIIAGLGEHTISAWSIARERELWRIDRLGEMELSAAHILKGSGDDFDNDGVEEVVGASGNGIVFEVNPVDGNPWWAREDDLMATAIATLPDLDADGRRETLAGFEDGSVLCLSSRDGEVIWGYSGDGAHPALSIFPFDDVDLGGTPDLVGMFGDGMVRCISSYGDLSAPPRVGVPAPLTALIGGVYPNPFNGPVSVEFALPAPGSVTLTVFDQMGRQVSTFDLGELNPATHRIVRSPAQSGMTASGVYLFRVESWSGKLTARAAFVK